MPRNYWLDLFTGTTWKEFLDAGGNITGFRESRWKSVQQIKPGDYLLCYLTGLSRWIGLLEVTGSPYKATSPTIWSKEIFPCRIPVKVIIELEPQTAIPVKALKDVLSYFQDLKSPNAWTGHFRGSPVKEKAEDAMAVIDALKDAQDNPVIRPVDKKKLLKEPKIYVTQNGEVTIPEDLNEEIGDYKQENETQNITHEEIQWLLLN